MSLIDQLISIKKATSGNDILAMMDEFILYERLSRSSALGDLETSPVLQKRLPLIHKAISDNIYELSLFIMAGNIINHLTGETPEHINEHMMKVPELTKKRLQLAQENTLSVRYYDLTDYHHALYEDQVVAVYTNVIEPTTSVIIITYTNNAYNIFQGSFYDLDNEVDKETKEEKVFVVLEDYIFSTQTHSISIETYSAQGNNGYPFGTYDNKESIRYLMLPDDFTLWILPSQHLTKVKPDEITKIPLTVEEVNRLTMSKHTTERFAMAISAILTRWENES